MHVFIVYFFECVSQNISREHQELLLKCFRNVFFANRKFTITSTFLKLSDVMEDVMT